MNTTDSFKVGDRVVRTCGFGKGKTATVVSVSKESVTIRFDNPYVWRSGTWKSTPSFLAKIPPKLSEEHRKYGVRNVIPNKSL